jgi:hypothetical protein
VHRRGFHATSLDSGTQNDLTDVRTAVQKELMVVTPTVSPVDESLKPVEVQLALKRSQFALAKVSRKSQEEMEGEQELYFEVSTRARARASTVSK